jgi:hypothetical protein
MESVKNKYMSHCSTESDIYEHLPTLCSYASKCQRVLELGVRGCVSSWALLYGLLQHSSMDVSSSPISQKQLILNDIEPCPIDELLQYANHCEINVDIQYHWINDLELSIEEPIDLVFIDTWHVYGQLKRELQKFGPLTKQYIIMHDTEIDGINGESIRCDMDMNLQSTESGIPVEEISRGIQPAINEFLIDHPNWILLEHFQNNNGLTILQRIETKI